MAYSLGNAVTNHFLIGTFELRIGPLSQAGRLSSAQSVGLAEAFNLNSQINTTTLSASYPRRVVDSAVTSSLSSFGVTLREYSARNLRMLMGEGVSEYSDAGGFTATAAVGSTVFVGSEKIAFPSLGSDSYASIPLGFDLDKESSEDTAISISTTGKAFILASNTDSGVRLTSPDFSVNKVYKLTLTIPKKTTAKTFTVYYEREKVESFLVVNASSYSVNNAAQAVSFVVPKDVTAATSAEIEVYFKAKADMASFVIRPPKGYVGSVAVALDRPGVVVQPGDTLSLVDAGNPANPIITEVVSFNSATAPNNPGLTVRNAGRSIPTNTVFTISKCETVGAGNLDTNKRFFTASLIHLDRGGKIPLVYEFWKCSLESGMDLSVDVTQFSSTQFQVKVLKPTLTDTRGVLSHVADEIAQSPTWRYSSLPVGL